MYMNYRCVLLLALIPQTAGAQQSVVYESSSPAPSAILDYGRVVAGLGDVEGNGSVEIAVLSPMAERIDVLSGPTGTLLYSVLGVPGLDDFVAAPDLDGDGLPDMLVGSESVRAYRGLDGALLYELGTAITSLIAIADQDLDGVSDFAAGVEGNIELRSGADGALIRTLPGPGTGNFGRLLADVGDANGDGTLDFATNHDDEQSGLEQEDQIRIVSGADGATLTTIFNVFQNLGALAPIDYDGNGQPEIVALGNELFFSSTRPLRMFDTASGNELWSVPTKDLNQPLAGFGLAVSSDLNGDGISDIAVEASIAAPSTPGTFSALAVYSGSDGQLLLNLRSSAVPSLSIGVAAVGDIDGDQFPDFAQGPLSVKVYSGRQDCNANGIPDFADISAAPSLDSDNDGILDGCSIPVEHSGTTYCSSDVSASGCMATMRAFGTASVSQASLVLQTSNAQDNTPAVMFYGMGRADFPINGATFCVNPPTKRVPIMFTFGTSGACAGSIAWQPLSEIGDFPGIQAGDTLNFQTWMRDPFSSPGTAFSDAVEVAVGP